MAGAAPRCQACFAVSEMLIEFQRPDSLPESEMRDWIAARARSRRPWLALREPSAQALLLHVELDDDSAEAADEQLTELMLDMRLLGLRPALVTPGG
jgi:hypothetical protein